MMEIKHASLKDAPALADLFLGHIGAHPEYISHGELQMGVGEGTIRNGVLEAYPAQDAREKWMRYIRRQIHAKTCANVWKAMDEGAIVGFCVADIEDDGDAPFGVVCDLLVKPDYRGHGAGGALLQTALDWLRSKNVKGIYLESGKDNHAAHRFFEKRGFAHVSEIYKLA
jgi:ribosomal protein S18 acetylase RimI-like enzyme